MRRMQGVDIRKVPNPRCGHEVVPEERGGAHQLATRTREDRDEENGCWMITERQGGKEMAHAVAGWPVSQMQVKGRSCRSQSDSSARVFIFRWLFFGEASMECRLYHSLVCFFPQTFVGYLSLSFRWPVLRESLFFTFASLFRELLSSRFSPPSDGQMEDPEL